MSLSLRRRVVKWSFGTILVLSASVVSAQRPLNMNDYDLRNQYGTMPGLNDQNPNQIQYGNIGGVVDNNAPQEADTTQKPPKIPQTAGVLFLRRFDSLATELRMEGQSRTERRRDHRGRHGAQRFPKRLSVFAEQRGLGYAGQYGRRFGSARFLSETPI